MSSNATDVRETCSRVQARLERLLDGELSRVEAARDEGHLEACAACRAEREREEHLLALLREPAEDLTFALEGLDSRLDQARAPRRAFVLLRGLGVQAALTAAAGLLALFLLEGVVGEVELGRPHIGSMDRIGAAWVEGLEAVLGVE